MENYFRQEIAGLRALAVIGVILFHLKIAGFQGGFIGVDVFFVISGYLISRNILRDLDRFSFAQFYMRRSRRIFPALIFTVAVTYLLGALWCSPLMFLDLAKEGTHALLSIANIQYWRESQQYFAAASDELALLHTWSLSAEEQFYLFWPAFLVLAKKTGRPFLTISLAALASLIASLVVAKNDPLAAFFLTPFRIFEFGVGALLLALRGPPKGSAAEALSGVGIAAIVASATLFCSDMPYLNAFVLVPCLGAAAVIWAGDRTRIAKLIANRPMLWLGAISYSLYLCHWPIIFFGRFIFGALADTMLGITAMAAIMLVSADLMHRFVERRFIRPSVLATASFGRTAIGLWTVLVGLAAITFATFRLQGLPWRLPEAQAAELRLQSFPTSRDIPSLTGPLGVQFVGDSLILQYAYGFGPTLQKLNVSFELLGGAGCPILEGAALRRHALREGCIKTRDYALARLAQGDLPIVYMQRWRLYDDEMLQYELESNRRAPIKGTFNNLELALERTIQKLVAHGHRILLVGTQIEPDCAINLPRRLPGPLPHAPPQTCPSIQRSEAERAVEPTDGVLQKMVAKWPDKVSLVRMVGYFCENQCPVVMNGILLFNASNHLSIAGVDHLMSRAEGDFRKFLEHKE